MLSSLRSRVGFRSRSDLKHRSNVDGAAAPSAANTRHQQSPKPPSNAPTVVMASLYVLSGVTQPLLMTLAKEAGVADPSCQVYMLFYYLGPGSLVFPLLCSKSTVWPSQKTLYKALLIACCDLLSQTVNYTGSSMAGPTLFAIIYSSVAVWTAVFSRVILKRRLTAYQWCGVIIVFGGLTLTGLDSVAMGPQVWRGSCWIVMGSMMNAFTYVLSESIMKGKDQLSVQVNCGIQASVGCMFLSLWQALYTRSRYETLILKPMEQANTTFVKAASILLAFAVANLIHYVAFFYTLKHFWGGATSAGVMKALQAVLVFAFTSRAYCGRVGGNEMCFSLNKLASLMIVVGGVLLFGIATSNVASGKSATRGYTKKESNVDEVQL